jgi:hypothetical protein
MAIIGANQGETEAKDWKANPEEMWSVAVPEEVPKNVLQSSLLEDGRSGIGAGIWP